MTSSRSLPLSPDLSSQVDDAEYARLLGYPQRKIPAGTVHRRAEQSRRWYARNARSWACARTVAVGAIGDEEIELADGTVFASRVLAARLASAGSTALEIAAVSAGPEVDDRSATLWREERPDEAWLLDRFGAAVAEHLAAWTGHHLRETASNAGLGALPGYSPGYESWDLEEQVLVTRCLTAGGADKLPGPFEVLASGMIRPKNSLLAVFGLTPDLVAATTAWRANPCSWCSLAGCDYRRPGREDSNQVPRPEGAV